MPSKHGRKECCLLRFFSFIFGLSGFGPELQSPGSEVSLCLSARVGEARCPVSESTYSASQNTRRGAGKGPRSRQEVCRPEPSLPYGGLSSNDPPGPSAGGGQSIQPPQAPPPPGPPARVMSLMQKADHCPPIFTVHSVFFLSLKCDRILEALGLL